MTWELTEHVCAKCFSRVLVRGDGGGRVVKCSGCEAEKSGGPAQLCACGYEFKTGGNAGLRCRRLDAVDPGHPLTIGVANDPGGAIDW